MDNLDPLPEFRIVRPQPSFPRWSTFFLLFSFVCLLGMLILYTTPALLMRWWMLEAQADAEASYLKRQAELKAESESADHRLKDLDKRVQLVSLGFREVARKVAPTVVNIRNEVEVDDAGDDHALFFDLETRRTYIEQGEGSGVLIKPGWVMTNNHVVRKAQRLRILFANGAYVVVKPNAVAADPLTDLAVIRLPASMPGELAQAYAVTTEFADSDKEVQVGDWTLAVGSPFGLKQTVTAGIISAKGRVELGILDQVDLLQTDAAINPGNSGGPLFDQRGRVVGINVAIASKTGVNQGIGFAIPSNTAQAIFAQLMEKGEVVRGFLGIGMQELPADVERKMRIGDTGGVLVTMVRPGTPAHQAGLRTGDVIVRYDQTPVGTSNAVNQLRKRIASTDPEKTVPIEFIRDKKRQTVEATISKRTVLQR